MLPVSIAVQLSYWCYHWNENSVLRNSFIQW